MAGMAGSVRGQRTHVHVMGALGIGDQDDLALTRHNLLHVETVFSNTRSWGGDDDHYIRAELRAALLA